MYSHPLSYGGIIAVFDLRLLLDSSILTTAKGRKAKADEGAEGAEKAPAKTTKAAAGKADKGTAKATASTRSKAKKSDD